jgi:hypothetical protein
MGDMSDAQQEIRIVKSEGDKGLTLEKKKMMLLNLKFNFVATVPI